MGGFLQEGGVFGRGLSPGGVVSRGYLRLPFIITAVTVF